MDWLWNFLRFPKCFVCARPKKLPYVIEFSFFDEDGIRRTSRVKVCDGCMVHRTRDIDSLEKYEPGECI